MIKGHHRELNAEQLSIGIHHIEGNHVKTEPKTRAVTDSWLNRLRKQLPPNPNGIQCYDPRLNRHIVKQMDTHYRKHIHVKAPDPTLSAPSTPYYANDISELDTDNRAGRGGLFSPISSSQSKLHLGRSLSNKYLLQQTLTGKGGGGAQGEGG